MPRKHRFPAHVLGGSKLRGRRASWLAAVGISSDASGREEASARIAAADANLRAKERP